MKVARKLNGLHKYSTDVTQDLPNRLKCDGSVSGGRNEVEAAQSEKEVVERFEDRARSRCLICGLEGYADDITTHLHSKHKVRN